MQRKKIRSKLKRVLPGLFIVVLLTMGLLHMFQERLIFQPTKLSPDYQYAFQGQFEELFVTASDGAKLNALHFKATQPKGIIVYFHGNAGDLSRWGEIVLFFVHKGYDVLVMDYRTYGKSTGRLSEKALYQDAELFYQYALKKYREEQIIVYGRSLGCTFATHVAANNKPSKLLLETPFHDLAEVAKAKFPMLPVSALLKYRFPTNSYINEVTCPITIFHGTADEVVPFGSGKRLFDTIDKSQKRFIKIPKGNHNDLINFKEYHKGIGEIL